MDQPSRLADEIIVRHGAKAEFRELVGEGGVLLHLDTADYFGVNAVGALIWEYANDITFGDLVACLRKQLEGVPDTFEQEVSEFLLEMHSRSLLQIDSTSSPVIDRP